MTELLEQSLLYSICVDGLVCFALLSCVFPCEFEQLRFRFVYFSLTGLTNRGAVLLK